MAFSSVSSNFFSFDANAVESKESDTGNATSVGLWDAFGSGFPLQAARKNNSIIVLRATRYCNMDFERFSELAVKIKNLPLPGTASHYKMAPELRIRELKTGIGSGLIPKKAGVMALFYPRKGEACLLLIQRKTYDGVHSGQIGFPGGGAELSDRDILATALRETHEEVGIVPDRIEVVRSMSSLYIPPSNYEVQPFIGLTFKAPPFVIQETEIESLLETSFEEVMDEANLVSRELTTSYARNIEVPAFYLGGHYVWGATGMVLNEIRDLFKQVL